MGQNIISGKEDDSKDFLYPNGWVIKTYRHINVSHSDFSNTEDFLEKLKADETYPHRHRDIAYGIYDRIQMSPVNSFSEFSNKSNATYNWYGSSQAILLFPLEKDDYKRHFVWQNDEEGKSRNSVLICNDDKTEQLNGFFAITFFYLSDEVRNQAESYKNLLDYCQTAINELVQFFNSEMEKEAKSGVQDYLHSKVTAEIFGSFSSAELVVLWSSKQYTDILYLIDCILDFRIPIGKLFNTQDTNNNCMILFRTAYTTISYHNKNKHDLIKSKDTEQADIRGKAQIQFVMQYGAGRKSYLDFESFFNQCIKNAGRMIGENVDPCVKLIHCAGEYDLIADVDGKYIFHLFSDSRHWENAEKDFSKDNPDYFSCSVHHPRYNEFALYSLTRLSYVSEDLPDFVESSQESGWDIAKKEISKENYILVDNSNSFTSWRSNLLNKIEEERKKELNEILDLVSRKIPTISNLRAEINQLFSDYVQCCCASADYIWIEDYDEIVQQALSNIRDSLNGIVVWENDEKTLIQKSEWENARELLAAIGELIQAIHQLTSHISASSKLLFKEQEFHFGYTAQHDLVMHAYYNIIKYLIQTIYSYTNKTIQSTLYPLVNFTSESHISSKIFKEESADLFMKDYNAKRIIELRSRIMVIQIPLDGMDNLLHYLPMLVHEVYHYAAPRNRSLRNQILQKIATYFDLKMAFLRVFKKASMLELSKTGHVDHDDHSLYRSLEVEFCNLIEPVIYKLIEENEESLYRGLEKSFFVAETGDYCDEDFVKEVPILRNWFVLWLKGWLTDLPKRSKAGVKVQEEKRLLTKKTQNAGENHLFENYSDFLYVVFPAIGKKLISEKKKQAKYAKEGRLPENRAIYARVLGSLIKEINGSLQRSNDEVDENGMFQKFAALSLEFKNNDLPLLLNNFDEIFPDLAMAITTNMPASGYMLQIALTLDKQFYHGDSFKSEYVRFAPVLDIIFSKELNGKTNKKKHLKTTLEEFKKIYVASFLIAEPELKVENIGSILSRAEEWCQVFNHMYMAWSLKGASALFGRAKNWVYKLIQEMIDCLQPVDMGEDEKEERSNKFIEPYKRYIEILKKDANIVLNTKQTDRKKLEKVIKQKQSDLFHLGLETILKFQGRRSLKDMVNTFDNRSASRAGNETFYVPRNQNIKIYKNHERILFSIEEYATAIQFALDKLYRYRIEEGVPSATGMWYRGVSHAEYPVLPSGFVHFFEDAGRLRRGFPNNKESYYYIQAQLHNYEAFRYSVEGSTMEIDPSRYYSTINYLTLMQHYRQHTNLLDWSEDAFASTYFALEDEIVINDKYDHERAKKEKNFPNRDADGVLYILDPVRFNIACREIEGTDIFVQSIMEKSNRKDINVRTKIPNLSIKDNHSALKEYHELYIDDIPANKDWFIKIGHNIKSTGNIRLIDIKNDNKTLAFHLPRAIYTAKLNARIRAQSGLFVAFSLNSLPALREDETPSTEKISDKYFDYQSLEGIQNYYLSMKGKNPFLMKIIIPADMKERMGKLFYRYGISKERIYPELENYRNR